MIVDSILSLIRSMKTIDVASLNEIREALHVISPFRSEPVDFVKWVPIANVYANDYNPNEVAPPEMELLLVSIQADGYTQPNRAAMPSFRTKPLSNLRMRNGHLRGVGCAKYYCAMIIGVRVWE